MIKIKHYSRRVIFIIIFLLLLYIIWFFPQQNFNNYNINLDKIFDSNLSLTERFPKEKILTFISTGDVSFSNEINISSINQYKNFNWPFEKILPVLRQADISIINLESPLFPDCIVPGIRIYILCGNSKFIDGLTHAGIDVVNVANNHIIDYGIKNASEGIRLLKNANIIVSGLKEESFINVKKIKIGFLGFNDHKYNDIEYARYKESYTFIYQASDTNEMIYQIKKMKQKNDILVVSFHWGKEYTDRVTERQKYLAHLAVDSGADLIIGNHPHWIQPLEIYKNKLIVYSHGNLVFDQKIFEYAKTASEETRTSIVGKYYFVNNKIIDAEFIPVKMDYKNQPHFVDDKDKRQILKRLKDKSYQLIRNK